MIELREWDKSRLQRVLAWDSDPDKKEEVLFLYQGDIKHDNYPYHCYNEEYVDVISYKHCEAIDE